MPRWLPHRRLISLEAMRKHLTVEKPQPGFLVDPVIALMASLDWSDWEARVTDSDPKGAFSKQWNGVNTRSSLVKFLITTWSLSLSSDSAFRESRGLEAEILVHFNVDSSRVISIFSSISVCLPGNERKRRKLEIAFIFLIWML